MSNAYDIPRAQTPNEVGVSSRVVKSFLEDAVKQGYEFHSLMVIRHGKVAVEWYNEPYNKDTPQSVYSVSKSFTSTAIGFAISDKRSERSYICHYTREFHTNRQIIYGPYVMSKLKLLC